MGDKLKIDKSATYTVRFVHCLDDDDSFESVVVGKWFYRMRGKMLDLGYEVKSMEVAVNG